MRQEMSKVFPFLTLGLGQTKGREARVIKWTGNGPRCLGVFPVIWDTANGQKWYQIPDLIKFWTLIRPKLGGKSLRELIAGCTAFGFSSWGADLILLDQKDEPLAAVNYPSVLKSEEIGKIIKAISPVWWHMHLEGASQAAYQPIGVLSFMHQELSGDLWSKVASIVPVTDYLGYLLHGQKGHDPTMLQSQGLLGRGTIAVEQSLANIVPRRSLCPWPIFPVDRVIRHRGVCYIPGSHDSVYSRIVGFAMAPYVVWTGSWLGVAVSIEGRQMTPNKETCEAGLSFEGLAPRAVQKNTGMFGPVFEELRTRAGLDYRAADDVVLSEVNIPFVDLSKINSLPKDEAADYVMQVLVELEKEKTPIPRRALALVVFNAAASVVNDLKKLKKVTGIPLKKITVVGGWAHNRAFCALLHQLSHAEVVVPPHAPRATETGYAAVMIRRILRTQKVSMRLDEILRELPEIAGSIV